LEELGVEGTVHFSRSAMQAHALDLSVSGNEQAGGYCEFCNELRGSIKSGKFLV